MWPIVDALRQPPSAARIGSPLLAPLSWDSPSMLDIAAACLVVTALLAYVNHRFIGLPTTIGVMVTALAFSMALVALDAAGIATDLHDYEASLLRSIDFSDVLMQGMLSMLLFAGALHVDISELAAYRWQVGLLALAGTLLSTLMVGVAMWLVLPMTGVPLPLLHCLLFGALISPTDPIAVMGILRTARAPKNLELVISGESLFNDGVGVVVFSTLLATLASGEAPTVGHALELLLHEAGGGLLYGVVLGYGAFRLLKSVDHYQVEVMLTLATVLGGYALASKLHVSGPLAMVVVGLMIGNHGRRLAMSDTTRRYLDMFWELLDEMLNAVLFVLIGMEVILVTLTPSVLTAAAAAIAVTLLARLLTVGVPVRLLRGLINLPAGAWQVLTWGGLRGGISVALALSLPLGHERDVVLALTYCVVVFSIVVQGLTIGRVTRAAIRGAAGTARA
ncbi:MAG TPA: sodium:proton antiporter [Vicinamibacterales bacterium]|nr:sodium:proton antiporter [Vicinamibacterales bacterium]